MVDMYLVPHLHQSVKKTAFLFGKEFHPEVAQTVDKNMYVDDLMKHQKKSSRYQRIFEIKQVAY